ncbi:MAG TPA: APC family permease [Acidimicrobiales bacterium]|jgi:amino acid transporter|nr:APC family permease [Acidimicrobiales bacterium]
MARDAQRKTSLGGKRKLTLIDTIAQSVGLMGPVFSIAFLVPLIVGLTAATGTGAGNAASLAVLIAAIGVTGLGWIIAEYTRKIQAAGSLYDYVTDGLGGLVGSAAGWLYYAGMLALGAGILPMIGGTIHDTILSEFHRAPLAYWVWDVALLIVVGTIIYVGVALSTRVQLTLALISVSVVLVFSIYVIVKSGGVHHLGTGFSPNSSPTHWKGVFFGVLYGVLLFTGFETSANLAEETNRPEKNIPRAVLTSVLVIGGFYVIGSFAQVSGFHFNLNALGKNAGAPLFTLAGPKAAGGFADVGIRRLVELVVIFDMIAVLIGCAVSASRGIFALARDARLPRSLSRISKFGTPSSASGLVVIVYGVIIALVAWTTAFAIPTSPPHGLPEYVSMFSWMSTFGGFAIAVIYLFIALGALRGLRAVGKSWQLYLACLVGGLVTIAAIYGAIYKVTAPTVWAPYSAIALLVVGLIAAFAMPKKPVAMTEFSGLRESERGPIKL